MCAAAATRGSGFVVVWAGEGFRPSKVILSSVPNFSGGQMGVHLYYPEFH